MAVSSGNRRKKQRRIIPNVQHSEAELTTKTTAVSRTEDTQGAEKTQDSSSSAAPANLELKDALVAQDGAHSEGGRGGEEGETCKASTGDAAASCSGNGDGRPKLSDKNDKIQNSEEPKANNDSSHKEHCANNDENAKGQKQQQHQEEEKGTIGTTTTSTIRSSGSSTTTNANDKTSYKNIKYAIVQNKSGGLNTSQTLQRLIALKSLFAKQLPKMPKEYIARLVFDRNHKSLALLNPDVVSKRTSSSNNGNDNGGGFVGDDEIIGGICYRSYADMKFAEIAFCAVSASQQVKVRCFLVEFRYHDYHVVIVFFPSFFGGAIGRD